MYMGIVVHGTIFIFQFKQRVPVWKWVFQRTDLHYTFTVHVLILEIIRNMVIFGHHKAFVAVHASIRTYNVFFTSTLDILYSWLKDPRLTDQWFATYVTNIYSIYIFWTLIILHSTCSFSCSNLMYCRKSQNCLTLWSKTMTSRALLCLLICLETSIAQAENYCANL